MILSLSAFSQAVSAMPFRTCFTQSTIPIIQAASTNLFPKSTSFSYPSFYERLFRWKIALALDTGGFPSNGGQDDDINEDTAGIGQTRLSRIVIAAGRQLLEKLNSARKNFPMKVFLLLLGFYTANALATILGQTGDWDVLVAGIVVAAVEGVGMLMYKRTPSPSSGRLQSLIVLINYWKAGVCLGLFVDAFKLGS
ncbi:ycf20-like protein [Silene latifolia]|uniref:ycf20-like protein n=1 Tax=Silene latifolia TaxID=37657 RepID=UPI003D7840BC